LCPPPSCSKVSWFGKQLGVWLTLYSNCSPLFCLLVIFVSQPFLFWECFLDPSGDLSPCSGSLFLCVFSKFPFSTAVFPGNTPKALPFDVTTSQTLLVHLFLRTIFSLFFRFPNPPPLCPFLCCVPCLWCVGPDRGYS